MPSLALGLLPDCRTSLPVPSSEQALSNGLPGRYRSWGLTAALIRLDELLQSVQINHLVQRGLHYQLSRTHPDSGQNDVFAASVSKELSGGVTFNIEVPNGLWKLRIWPRQEPLQIALVIEVFLVGLLAIVCAYFVFNQARLPVLLQTEVQKKTNELKETNDRLLVEIQERQEAQSKLKLAHDDLEQRIEERTAHLQELNEKLQSEIHERKRLESEILEIQETERQRIARDLHVDLGQQLTGLSFMLQTLENKLVSKEVEESDDVNQIANFLDQAISQTRVISRQLYAEEIVATGLIPALRNLAGNINHSFGIDCRVESSETSIDLKIMALENLYRIAQEAVNNAVRHGKPEKIQILLSRENGSYCMEISDDGIGFDSTAKQNGLGQRSIEYRARSIGGTFDIDTRDTGCCVRCVVPAND